MQGTGLAAGLRKLSFIYLVGVSAFGAAIAMNSSAPWALHVQEAVRVAAPYVKTAAATVGERAVKPAADWLVSEWQQTFGPAPAPVIAGTPPQKKVAVVKKAPPAPEPVAVPKQQVASLPAKPLEIAPEETPPAPLLPAPDANPPSPDEVAHVVAYLKVNLTKELYQNFDLFLFVSKADRGPWSQRMFVFRKEASGDLDMLYSFPVSTGREVLMAGPSGQVYQTDTPSGYYEIDPDRTFRHYHSVQWDQAMPYAMFFNWEHDGLQTGLAIHAASGGDIDLLGTRASAGCVRLHPQNAHLLFDLIRRNYRGLAPRFAYDYRTATMAKDGLLMHDKDGNLKFAEGYKVLVLIENKGGNDVIAALF